MNGDRIPVILTVDEKYLRYARVTILSVLRHAAKRPVEVIIGHYDIPASVRQAFLETVDAEFDGRHTLRFVSLKPEIDRTGLPDKMRVTARFPISVAYRLVLPEALPHIDKFIYLDSDVIVARDLSDLYELDLTGHWVAAVRGVGFPSWVTQNPSRLNWYRQHGIDVPQDYFNNGVMVVDAKAFRDHGLLPKLVDYAIESPYFPDQDALNFACRGHVRWLDLEWNVALAYCRQRQHEQDGEPFAYALEHASVLHFNTTEKPWNHPAQFRADAWWQYATGEDYGPTAIDFYYYNDWPNFGDSLSQKLMARLTGARVEHVPQARAELMGTGSLFSRGERFFGAEEKPSDGRSPVLHVWGSGFLDPKIPEGKIYRYRDMIVHAVRGQKTLDVLKRVGYVGAEEVVALGDPGLFYADLFPESRTVRKRYDIALIPHRHDQVAALKLADVLREHGYSVVYVDVMLSEPRDVILQIAASRKVISSSLHGIIVADSLGIPNRRLVFEAFANCPQCQHSISHFKFADYYSAFALEAPAYETEAHLLANPREVVEAIRPTDCVPAKEVEACKAALRTALPIPIRARREPVPVVVEPAQPKDRRMKVLMVCEPDFLNPFPQHIYNELLEYDLDADCSADLFWTCDPADYDIVHVQFPEALFKWRVDNVTPAEYQRLVARLNAFRAAGCKIVYTRHNQTVHVPRKGCIDKVYRMLDAESDGILHMGRYSLMECKGKNPNRMVRHYLVPHHTYPHLLRRVDQRACRIRLGLDPDRPVVLSFGSFRNDAERALVRNAVAACGVTDVQLLAPALDKGCFVSDHDLPVYFGAADVVFLQRLRILNSGNLPLAFYYGKVVVGPNLCDVGEWLRATGNPVFEAFRPGSEATALAQGLALARQGLGARNRAFADREWSLEAVGARIVAAYADVTGRPVPARTGVMQFKRIDVGVAVERLRARDREHRANLEKAAEIRKLRAEVTRVSAANKAKIQSLSREVTALKASTAYRVGMFVTWPLRKIYRAIRTAR